MWSTIRELRREQLLHASIEEAWRYFSNPSNLPDLTPPSLAFRVEDSKLEPVYPGMILKHRVSPILGIPMTWVTEITHVDEPKLFVDEQRIGPYRFWHHQHRFEVVDGGVRMTDIVHYSPPFGPFGAIMDIVWIRRQLEFIFEYRRQGLAKRFPSD